MENFSNEISTINKTTMQDTSHDFSQLDLIKNLNATIISLSTVKQATDVCDMKSEVSFVLNDQDI